MNIETLSESFKPVRKTVAPWNVRESDRIMLFDIYYGFKVPRQISRIEKTKGCFTGSSLYTFFMKNGEVAGTIACRVHQFLIDSRRNSRNIVRV